MRLEWLRPKSELKDVLMEPRASGPDITYWIFSGLSKDEWQNMTIIAPGLYGKEFTKTYGHYHPPNTFEISKLINGDGIYMLQKKFYEKGKWIPDKVAEVYMVKLSKNEQIVVPPDFAHAWSNVGSTPLIVFDDWDVQHTSTDYQEIKRLHGLSYYVVSDGKGIKFIPNPNYKNHPEPKVLTSKEFQKLYPVS